MKQFLGLLIGGGSGALIGFYMLLWGYDVGAVLGVISDPAVVAGIAGFIGAVVGLMVSAGFARGVGRDQDRRTRIVVGGLGGAASGAIYGAITSMFAISTSMVTLGFVLHDDRSSVFAGALGGFIIGIFCGLVLGVFFGGIIGSFVGAFVGAMAEASPPPKPDLTILGEENEKKEPEAGPVKSSRSRTSASSETAGLLKGGGRRSL